MEIQGTSESFISPSAKRIRVDLPEPLSPAGSLFGVAVPRRSAGSSITSTTFPRSTEMPGAAIRRRPLRVNGSLVRRTPACFSAAAWSREAGPNCPGTSPLSIIWRSLPDGPHRATTGTSVRAV